MQEAATLAHERCLNQLRDVLRFMEQAKGGLASNALVIDGKALTHALAADVKQLFLQVSCTLMLATVSVSLLQGPRSGRLHAEAAHYQCTHEAGMLQSPSVAGQSCMRR